MVTASSRHNLAANDPDQGAVEALVGELARLRARLRELEAQLEELSSPAVEPDAAVFANTLLDNLQDCILVVTQDGAIRQVAGNSVGLLGYTSAELVGTDRPIPLVQLVAPDDQQRIARELGDLSGRPRRTVLEARVIDRAGEARWVELTVVPLYGDLDGELAGFEVILRDISERVRTESVMRSLNEAAQTVQKASLSLDDVLEAVTSQLRAQGFYCAIGLMAGQLDEIHWVKLAADERRLQAAQELSISPLAFSRASIPAFGQALSSGRLVQGTLDERTMRKVLGGSAQARQLIQLLGRLWFVVAPLRADGRELGLLVVASPSPRPESLPAIEAFANQTSIAVRNAQLVERIAERESQYRAIFEAARDGLLVLDERRSVVAASAAAAELFGYPVSEMLGLSLDQLVDLTPSALDAWAGAVRQGGENGTIQAMAVRSRGERFPVEMRGSQLDQGASVRLLVLITDTTERVRAQQALIQAERLGALGQMAGGIAHDFNNILVSILGHAQMAREDLTVDPSTLLAHLEQIELGARDAADAVSRLQSLYRETDDRSDFIPVQLDDLLMEALALNRPRWKDIPQMQGLTFHIETELRRPAPVLGNPSELRRVLSNLIINAIDAMPMGGVLRFLTGEQEGVSYVSVQDTGPGVPEETRQRIFEPFFTTKKSSGLGLTISKSIVERHGGVIEVASAPGGGAIFTVRLPSHSQRPEATPASTIAAPATRCVPATLSILVVDDEVGVREVLARMLERQGHSVLTADSGQQGLAILEKQGFDLLICDLGMPDVQGPAVMQRAHALYPNMPIVLATGWGDSITPEQLQGMRAIALLPKPFGQDEVRRVVERALQLRAAG